MSWRLAHWGLERSDQRAGCEKGDYNCHECPLIGTGGVEPHAHRDLADTEEGELAYHGCAHQPPAVVDLTESCPAQGQYIDLIQFLLHP